MSVVHAPWSQVVRGGTAVRVVQHRQVAPIVHPRGLRQQMRHVRVQHEVALPFRRHNQICHPVQVPVYQVGSDVSGQSIPTLRVGVQTVYQHQQDGMRQRA